MEMRSENAAGKFGQVNTHGLSYQGDRGHSFQETTLRLAWVRLCFHAQIVDQLNRVNGLVDSYEIY
jgi:hypothetical protein